MPSPVNIGIVAPAARIDPTLGEQLNALAGHLFPGNPPHFRIHPQCYERCGHFAGTDQARMDAFVDYANDESLQAIWFARGGYGACRILPALSRLTEAARAKLYIGYSDMGFLLAGLYARGHHVAHGPMPADMNRIGGDVAVARSLRFLCEGAEDALEPRFAAGKRCAAFNITVLASLTGTDYMPDLTGHVLMLEEVSEHMYRIDRTLFHLTAQSAIRRCAGIMLGRCSDIPENDPDFVLDEEQVARHWCEVSNIPYLGRADIGHDAGNKIVPFG